MKNVLIILGNPIKNSFTDQILNAYLKGAEQSDANINVLDLNQLKFDLNFPTGYKDIKEPEPDLIKAQELILWANHIVFIYPNWWSTYPALLKGFIDRTFLPGFAFKYREHGLAVDKLLTGRSARLIVTMDSPPWYYKFVMKSPGHHSMKKGILNFCGISPVKITTLGPIKTASVSKKTRWLERVKKIGQKLN